MFNNQRLVAPSANFKWKAAWGGSEVFVTGDFTAWAVGDPRREMLMCTYSSALLLTHLYCDSVSQTHRIYICAGAHTFEA